MNKKSSTPVVPAPLARPALAAQFSVVPISAHTHNGVDSFQIQYKNLSNRPQVGKQALGTSASVSFDPSKALLFTLTPTQSMALLPTTFTMGNTIVIEVLTSGTTAYTITFSTGFVANGTLTTSTVNATYRTATFICDGTYWVELSRTPAMSPS